VSGSTPHVVRPTDDQLKPIEIEGVETPPGAPPPDAGDSGSGGGVVGGRLPTGEVSLKHDSVVELARRRKAKGVKIACADCGYDVSATPMFPCPECGSPMRKNLVGGHTFRMEDYRRSPSGATPVGAAIIGAPIPGNMQANPVAHGAIELCSDCGAQVQGEPGEPCGACGSRARTTPERLAYRQRMGRMIIVKLIATLVGCTLFGLLIPLIFIIFLDHSIGTAAYTLAMSAVSMVGALMLICSFIGWEEPMPVTLAKGAAIGVAWGGVVYFTRVGLPGELNVLGCIAGGRALVLFPLVWWLLRSDWRESVFISFVATALVSLTALVVPWDVL
jgi:DNA-directed RNA polymerase subunit RPC12/RpoP